MTPATCLMLTAEVQDVFIDYSTKYVHMIFGIYVIYDMHMADTAGMTDTADMPDAA